MPAAPTATPVPKTAPTANPMPTATPFVPQAPNDNTFVSGISADGRYVAFVSLADNLVEGDTNERPDVFVYDRYTGAIARVSVASDGTQSDGFSGRASISAHGRWIAFGSEAQSLEPDPVGWEWDTFVHDRQTGQTEWIDLTGEGTRGRRSITSSPSSLSADGRYVALAALVGEGGGPWHVYVHDRWTGKSERISAGADGAPGDGWSTAPALSADGRYVAFWSWAGNLVAGDERACGEAGERLSCGDVFLYDREAQRMERIPVGEGYGLGGGGYELSISDDGYYVVYRGSVYDRRTQTLSPYCGLDAEAQSKVQSSGMSADGRWIAFTDEQVYLCDRESGTIVPVSVAADGAPGDGPSGIVYGHEGYSGALDLSADGRWVVFTSQAGNLVPGEAKEERCRRPLAVLPEMPHCYDVYLYDRETGTMAKVGEPQEKPEAGLSSVPGSVIFYAQGGGLRSLPHQALSDRPEMETVYAALASSEGATNYLRLNALDASPDGRWLAVHDPLPSGPQVRLPGTTWLVDLAAGTLRNLGSPSAAVSWSPDGRALTYARQDTVYVLDLAGNEEPVAIWRQPGKRLFAARWSPTGEWIAVVGTDATYSEESMLEHWVVSPDGKTVAELGAIPLLHTEWAAREVEWAPDGALFSTLGGTLVKLDGETVSFWEHRERPEDLPDPLPLRLAEELALYDVVGGSRSVRASSHDGRRLAYGNVYVYDRAAGTHTRVGTIDDGRVNEIRWSADDGTLIVGVTRWQEAGLWGAIYALPPQPGSVPELLVEGEGVYLLDVILEVPGVE